MKIKKCSKCGKEYSATTDFFPPNKRTKDNLQSYCRSCHKENIKRWRENNPEKVRAASKKWRENNPEYPERYRYNSRKEMILKRDNYQCQICGVTQDEEKLIMHHFNENKKENRYWNLLTLCYSCHKYIHENKF